MSLASLAAAATVYDHIDDVVADTGVRKPVATAAIIQYGIASIDGDGWITMSERQSAVAARMIANMAGVA